MKLRTSDNQMVIVQIFLDDPAHDEERLPW